MRLMPLEKYANSSELGKRKSNLSEALQLKVYSDLCDEGGSPFHHRSLSNSGMSNKNRITLGFPSQYLNALPDNKVSTNDCVQRSFLGAGCQVHAKLLQLSVGIIKLLEFCVLLLPTIAVIPSILFRRHKIVLGWLQQRMSRWWLVPKWQPWAPAWHIRGRRRCGSKEGMRRREIVRKIVRERRRRVRIGGLEIWIRLKWSRTALSISVLRFPPRVRLSTETRTAFLVSPGIAVRLYRRGFGRKLLVGTKLWRVVFSSRLVVCSPRRRVKRNPALLIRVWSPSISGLKP